MRTPDDNNPRDDDAQSIAETASRYDIQKPANDVEITHSKQSGDLFAEISTDATGPGHGCIQYDPKSQSARRAFLQCKFVDLQQLHAARRAMGLVVGQSDNKNKRYRFRVKGDKEQNRIVTFRYNVKGACYQRAEGSGARSLGEILTVWSRLEVPNKDEHTPEPTQQRANVIWTVSAAQLVMDMVDPSLTRRYTHAQIAEKLNSPENKHLYKHTTAQDQTFTASNVQALLRAVCPLKNDAQDALSLLGKGG